MHKKRGGFGDRPCVCGCFGAAGKNPFDREHHSATERVFQGCGMCGKPAPRANFFSNIWKIFDYFF
ncbi:hypothetical protein DWUX_1241 [Desulfovibrio diazotrophicus]|nr:hypothetical protein DWUX_1241 [Desulfovibrio diazotrophicus]